MLRLLQVPAELLQDLELGFVRGAAASGAQDATPHADCFHVIGPQQPLARSIHLLNVF